MSRDPQRVRQIVRGVAVVGAISLFLALLFCGQFLPGRAGAAFGWMAGVMTTPFFMELGVGVIGFCTVLMLNRWRQVREGDDFVSLDDLAAREAAAAANPGKKPE